MEQKQNRDSPLARDWREDWDGQDSSIPEEPWVPDEIDLLLHPELAGDRSDDDEDDERSPSVRPGQPSSTAETQSRRTAPLPARRASSPVETSVEMPAAPPAQPAHIPTAEDSGFYYKSGKPIPPTHPDHGPMHLLPRQEDGSFAAYYYCSHAELAAIGDGDGRLPAPPPRRHRRDGFTAERQQLFVEYYRDTGSLTDAARLTGISRSTAYNLINRADGAAFRDAIGEAGRGIDTILEATAFERCINGQEEIVYHQGRRVGVRWKYDNKLLMQLLRARNPLKYAPLSEIEGWLKRRGAEGPGERHGDLDAALDRLAAAEAEWGRRLPGEGEAAGPKLTAPPTPLPFGERDGAAQPQQGEGMTGETIASISSTSNADQPAIASTSSTSPESQAGGAGEPPAQLSPSASGASPT